MDQNPRHNQRTRGLHLLIELASRSETVPQSLYLTDVTLTSRERAWPGGFADVYEGQIRGAKVAVKRLRGSCQTRAHIHRVSTVPCAFLFWALNTVLLQSFCKEGLLWRQLDHPNILPFIGVDSQTFEDDFCMVSPWMERGTLMEFLVSPDYSPTVDRMRLVLSFLDDLMQCTDV